MDSNKFKTMLCKHWDTSNGCSFGSRCQFAHGVEELRSFSLNTQSTPTYQNVSQADKRGNAQNYKIVKCKYWEQDGTCRYGSLCTFAHGDTELRTKADNLMDIQPNMVNVNPMMGGNQMNDPNFLMQMMMFQGMDPNQLMNMQMDPNFLMQMQMMSQMNPNLMGNMGNMGTGNQNMGNFQK